MGWRIVLIVCLAVVLAAFGHLAIAVEDEVAGLPPRTFSAIEAGTGRAVDGLFPPAPLSETERRDHEGLRAIPLPGGGYTIDLKGRFGTATRGVRFPDGRATFECMRGQVQSKGNR